MARFLFVSLPLNGHLDWGGMLRTAATLHRSGHTVAWASGPAVQVAVRAAGIPLISVASSGWQPLSPLPSGLSAHQRQQLRRQRALDAWLHPKIIARASEELRDILASWRPDLVVAEPYAAAAALAAESAGAPLAVCGRPALSSAPPETSPHPASDRIKELCKCLGVSGVYWDMARAQIRSPLVHLDFFSRLWYADIPYVASQTRFVGGEAAPWDRPGSSSPLVLVTLGSLFRQDPVFFQVAIDAVLLEGGQPLLVTGRPEGDNAGDELATQLPDGVRVESWIDFDETLPQLTGAIHHGGVGTTHALLRHGIPQIAVPHAGDQRPQAGRITQAKVGYGLRPTDFTVATARWAVRQLLHNEDLRIKAREWQMELHQLGGARAGAEVLEEASKLGSSVV